MKFLKAAIGVLIAIACTIAFFALTDEYERALRAPADAGRVIDVNGSVVRYEMHKPGSPWDKDGDGWIGPYSEKDVPEEKVAALKPGMPLVVRKNKLEVSLAPPSKLLLMGLVLGLAFTVWAFVGPMLEKRALEKSAANPQSLLEFMVRKTRSTKLIAGLLLLGMSGGIAAVGAVVDAKTWERIFIVGLGGMGILLGFFVLAGAWALRNVQNAPIIRLINDEPQRIVWIYEYRVVVNGVANHNIHVCCNDGQRFEFNIAQLDPTPLVTALHHKIPHAVVGYSEGLQSVYQSSPQTFLAKAATAC